MMNKLLEVREFDSIICNKKYKDEEKYKYLDRNEFDNLVAFIREFSSSDENENALNFMQVGIKKNVGDMISIKNYVGLIQMKNGFQVQILPKILLGNAEDKGNEETKRIFLRMLRSMKDFPSKVFKEASLNIAKMNLYEIFINMYLQEVRYLVKHGIKSAYIEHEDNLRFYKGKLKVADHIKLNVAHKERFYVMFDEYQVNRSENRIVKSTLLKLQNISNSAENVKEIRRLLTAFELVKPSVNYQKDFSKVVINRNTKNYEALMRWSKVFLMNNSFTTFSGNTDSRALLFPMEKVFESYVGSYMKRVFGQEGWHVSTQDKGYHLFNTPGNKFALRPDIVATKDNRIIVLDAKWKKINSNESKNYGISQADMYQMYAYAKKYMTSEIWLLYPVNEEMMQRASDLEKNNEKEDIAFTSEDNVEVHLFFVDVAHIEKSLKCLLAKINKQTTGEEKSVNLNLL